ncbi:pyridoxamine 5'-phosphate oxidase family protein [Streptomyces sp. CA-251247]|uniref:pyridoxamine 5'-phosphate oxidase family protein n=1 Tax=Streptomyces sp. CA-251247 TaxID=3240062 RepID=UPI003D8E494B
MHVARNAAASRATSTSGLPAPGPASARRTGRRSFHSTTASTTRTSPSGPRPTASQRRSTGTMPFEVDHIDDVMSEGWSVLAVGTARAVTAPHAVRRLNELAHSAPWAGGGDRTLWVALAPRRITGRRIVAVPPGQS